MKKFAPQILPVFTKVIALDESIRDVYGFIREYEAMKRPSLLHKTEKFAWLIDEDTSINDFINMLGGQDDASPDTSPIDMYDFFVARNITFPEGSVRLINEVCTEEYCINDMAELLGFIIKSRHKYLQHAIHIKPVWPMNSQMISSLRTAILQQFIYLRMYIPVIIADSYRAADKVLHKILYGTSTRQLAVTGTKKAGKTALINAMLGDIYSPSSSELPTPCAITYSAGHDTIRLEHDGITQDFAKPEELSTYLLDVFSSADKSGNILASMSVTIPAYPAKLDGITITDTPGSNFAADMGHREAVYSSLEGADFCLFVINYSSHLSDDEVKIFDTAYRTFNNDDRNRIVLAAVNRIDEMYSAPVVKSYERAADYISSRLKSLGYDNFLVLPVSALTSLHAIRNDIKAPFITRVIQDKADFHGVKLRNSREIEEAGRVKYLMHALISLMRQYA